MEHIGEVLQNYRPGMATPSHHQTQAYPARTGEEIARSLNVNLSHTFENFKQRPGTKQALFAFKGVLAGPRFMLLCYGGVGNGKTHLCEAAAIELYRMVKFCRVLNFARILNTLKLSISNPELSYDEILNNYCYADRLIVDDVGAGESDTEFGNRILETIVCARYGRELLTIMTTNRDISTLPERVLSRFADKTTSYLVHNEGDDYRRLKEQ